MTHEPTEQVQTETEMPTLAEAIKDLTGFDVLAIQKEFGASFENLSGVQSLIGTVWAYENRTGKRTWADVKAMSIRQLSGYFGKSEADPDSEAGKDPN